MRNPIKIAFIFLALLIVGSGIMYVASIKDEVNFVRPNIETPVKNVQKTTNTEIDAKKQQCLTLGVVAKNTIKTDTSIVYVPVQTQYKYYVSEDRCIFESYYTFTMGKSRVESGEITDLFTGKIIVNFYYSSAGEVIGNCFNYDALRKRYFNEGVQYCNVPPQTIELFQKQWTVESEAGTTSSLLDKTKEKEAEYQRTLEKNRTKREQFEATTSDMESQIRSVITQ